jgi:hypothetical protein
MEFYNELPAILKAFWLVALPVTIIFIIQVIMTFTGSDTSDGIDADFDGNLTDADAPFQLFSFRNLINFLLGFSWGGISLYPLISNSVLLVLGATITGALFVLMFFYIIQQIQKLAENNAFNLEKAINKTADVYLTIPANKSGKGKILVSVGGSVHEIEAITEKEKIETGALVKVIKLENDNIVLVEKL